MRIGTASRAVLGRKKTWLSLAATAAMVTTALLTPATAAQASVRTATPTCEIDRYQAVQLIGPDVTYQATTTCTGVVAHIHHRYIVYVWPYHAAYPYKAYEGTADWSNVTGAADTVSTYCRTGNNGYWFSFYSTVTFTNGSTYNDTLGATSSYVC